MMKKYVLLILLFFYLLMIPGCSLHSGTFYSPDKNISVKFSIKKNLPVFDVVYHSRYLLMGSSLGLSLADSSLEEGFSCTGIRQTEKDTVWHPVIGKNSKVRNRYNEWTIKLKGKKAPHRRMNIIFRLYDDGVALRYLFPEQNDLDTFTITRDLTTFSFVNNLTWWSANGEHANLGPLRMSALPGEIRLPFLAHELNDVWIAIHEAAIYHYSPFLLSPGDAPQTVACTMKPSRGKTETPTSWRVLFIGNSPGHFLESDLLQNLNPPCKIKDPSWIHPGKSMWDWRVWGYKAPDGFQYGLNTVSHKRFVDFAAKHHIRYMLLDADWYGPEFDKNSDPTQARKGIDIENFMDYAHKKGVEVILYLNDVGAKKYGLDTILSRFHQWGAAGVKYGFMQGEGQEKVLHTREVVRLCADYRLVVNFHDNPVPPSGDTRTWPNLIAREYCHSQADAKKSYWPETAVTAAFINMMTGPLDMDNGWFGLNHAGQRMRVFEPIPGTVAAEAAKMVVFWSGLMVLPDAPEEYEKKADLFHFIETLPDNYDEIRVPDGTPESHIVLARRKGDNWYVGCLTNREGRTLSLPLTFLKEGKYTATVYEDAPESHYLNHKESYHIRQRMVTAADTLTLRLAPGGGCAVSLLASH